MALGLWPLSNRLYAIRLPFDSFQSYNKADKADPLHVELEFRQLEVEPCLWKLREDALDVVPMLLERV
jgi:hypothetical protein